ncbi:hypothetical protein BGZ57DRAFT_896167 [Hyaloscypha finlandica]|nr:hypothetical protein BGZ57DRAFT_896167 [Hyaloscypha finlandica]
MKPLTASLFLSFFSLLSTSYATESIHLSNCFSAWDTGALTYSSEMEYYADDATSSNGQIPLSSNICQTVHYPTSAFTTWPGNAVSCTFSSGVTVTAHIDSNAGSRPLFSGCGWATNGFKNFNCFKDNGREVYSVDFGEGRTTCDSYYYCFPA